MFVNFHAFLLYSLRVPPVHLNNMCTLLSTFYSTGNALHKPHMHAHTCMLILGDVSKFISNIFCYVHFCIGAPIVQLNFEMNQ